MTARMMMRSLGITVTTLCAVGLFFACSSDDEGSKAVERDLPDGADCEEDVQCASGHCTGGTCEASGCPGGICIDPDGGIQGDADGGTQDVDDDRVRALRDASCAGWGGEAEPESPILMFVVDVSTSMKQEDPSNTSRTKWEVTQPVLLNAIDELPDSVAVGLLLYPNQPTTPSEVPGLSTDCVNDGPLVPIDRLDNDHREALANALDMTPPDNSGTPTHDALTIALDALDDARVNGARYVVLLTDGQPTYGLHCVGNGQPDNPSDEEPIIEEIRDALGDAIGTFVIGVPGSEDTVETHSDARWWLSEAAEAGGTAPEDCSHESSDANYCHFDMVAEDDYAEGLTDALLEIAERVVPCDYGLPLPPDGLELDPNEVNVILNASSGTSKLILKDDDPNCDEGWHWSEDQSRVLLCPDTCRELRLDRSASLEVLFGCVSVVEVQ